VSYATVLSEPFIETDDGVQDIFVNVQMHPSEQIETARVGTIYAGDGFGFYTPLHEGDEVLVGIPSGDPDECMVVIQRLFSPAAVPPPEVVENPEDVTLVVEEGKNVRIIAMGGGDLIIDTVDGSGVSINVQGSGNVSLNVDTGKVYLGAEEGTEPAAKGQSLKSYLESVKTAYDGHTHLYLLEGAPTATTGPSTPVPAPTSALLSTTTEVK